MNYSARRDSSLSLRMTRILIVIPLLMVFSGLGVRAQSQSYVAVRPVGNPMAGVLLIIDGKVVEAEALEAVRGQQVMVWIRDLEKLGWGTVQTRQPQQVLFKSKNVTLTFTKGQSVALVNSLAVRLPIDTYVRNGKLMVPLSFVAKALGYTYQYGYRVVARIRTSLGKVVEKGDNAIQGRVTYNGKAVKGIRVRAADAEFTAIRGAIATTDDQGRYKIEGLPDGNCMAYVFIDDNPVYITRASETVALAGGQTADLQPISLVRALTPLLPKMNQVARVSNGRVGFAWTPCEGAVSYKLVVKGSGTGEPVVQISSEKPSAEISAAKFIPGVAYEGRVTALDARGEFLGSTARAGGMSWTFTIEDLSDTLDT